MGRCRPGPESERWGCVTRGGPTDLLGVLLNPGALIVHPRRDLRAELLRLPNWANLEIARSRHRVGAPLGPLDGLFHRPDLPDPEPRHQLLRLGEGTVGHRALGPIEVDPLAELAGLEPVTGKHDPRLDQLLVEPSHLFEHLLGAFHLQRIRLCFRLLGSLHQHHDPHKTSSIVGSGRGGLLYPYVDRGCSGSTSRGEERSWLTSSLTRPPTDFPSRQPPPLRRRRDPCMMIVI